MVEFLVFLFEFLLLVEFHVLDLVPCFVFEMLLVVFVLDDKEKLVFQVFDLFVLLIDLGDVLFKSKALGIAKVVHS